MDEKEYASKGVAGAGLGLGIAGTALGLLAGGLGNIGLGIDNRTTEVDIDHYCQSFEGKIAQLESELARVNAERYADGIGIEVYKANFQNYKELDNKINSNLEKVYGWIIDLDKNSALNTQALMYENRLTNAKIDCCCDKANTAIEYNKQLQELADASIISYINSTFLPGVLRLPITSVCPTPAVATTSNN